ncbi:16S rRNA (uracil(1498)-N(3))-methyltransferase [Pleurocapsales cyanobacterium LEGE 06147]|nr:16S rRNA (uracil(1498)-N(3))-methyltransferase [Pleurocapsales cyanobacterium LEGE 06147]
MAYRLVIKPEQIQQQQIQLTSSQQHYLRRVLRLKDGDRFVAMDGVGKSWWAKIGNTSACLLEPIDISTELPVTVTLITALPKGNAYDEVVRCCTELGVSIFQPVISDRTLLKPSPHKLERWRRIVTEAAEQAERQIVPIVLEPVLFTEILTWEIYDETERYICVARGGVAHLSNYLQHSVRNNILIATGPEGGWTKEEVEKAIAVGYQPVSLGNRILRAVTAPIVALSLVAAAMEN